MRPFSLFQLLTILIVAIPGVLFAQDQRNLSVAPPSNEHRIALVIGNSAYQGSPLKNPVNDARAMRNKLERMGFEVIVRENLKTREVGSVLREFRSKIRPGSIALFFYAGHGLQIRGENYLPTVDADISSEEDVPQQSLSLNSILNTMEDSKAGVNLVLLDACRNNPYARSFRSSATGLARVQAPSGTLIHYATRPGSVAEDGKGKNGTYTEALLAQIEEKGVPIEQALKRVTVRVKNATKGKQEPWMEGSLTGDFYFILEGPTQVTIQQAPANAEAAAWQAAEGANTSVAYQAYLAEYPKGLYAAAARIKLASLEAPQAATPAAAVAPAPSSALPRADRDTLLWKEVQAAGSREHYDSYLKEYPRGKYAPLARAELKRLAARDAEQKAQMEKQVWESARQINTEDAYLSYLGEYPKGRFVPLAQAGLKKARSTPEPPPLPPKNRKEEERKEEARKEEARKEEARKEEDRKEEARKEERRKEERRKEEARKEEDRKEAARKEERRKEERRREGIDLTRISGADFAMGAAVDDSSDDPAIDEAARPQHNVKVANFEFGVYEVTVGLFRKFIEATAYVTDAERPDQAGCHIPGKGGEFVLLPEANWHAPGYAQTDSHPVVCVSWNDVQAYLAWLNGSTPAAAAYRLPSEAEWEFAARGGTITPRPWLDVGGFFRRIWEGAKTEADQPPPHRACKFANVADETLKKSSDWPVVHNCKDDQAFTSKVGDFGRNDFKLYDMIGNVAEWTQDCWNPNHAGAPADSKPRLAGDCTQRVVRGGGWASGPALARSAARQKFPAAYRASDVGFRIAKQMQ